MRALFCCIGLMSAMPAQAARLKDLVDVEGFRSNQLVGVGLVVGLSRTGDDASFQATSQPLAALLRHLGSQIDVRELKARNVALVSVTAELPPFARPGVRVDVTVSSLGNATSLQGGTLLVTALKAADRQTYALAQGVVSVGGYEAASKFTGSFQRKNHVTVARVAGGATVEREVAQQLPEDQIRLVLKEPDFTTAARIAESIGKTLGSTVAQVLDPGLVEVKVPAAFKGRVVALVATLEGLESEPDAPARVVIDERTGTVVAGARVTLSPVALAYGGLTIRIEERFAVSQPAPFGDGRSVVVPNSRVEATEQSGQMVPLPATTSVDDLAKALNALQVKPRDLVAIFQALKAAGALRAELKTL